jgi:hypothetical protein
VNFLRRLALQESKFDGSSRLDVVEIVRVTDMLPSFLPFPVGLRTYQHHGRYQKLFLEVKQLWREANHHLSCNSKVKNGLMYTSKPSIRHHFVHMIFTFTIPLIKACVKMKLLSSSLVSRNVPYLTFLHFKGKWHDVILTF